jgi:hypothetical protein
MQIYRLIQTGIAVDIVASDSYTDGRLPLAASWSQREDILANLSELQHSPVSRRSYDVEADLCADSVNRLRTSELERI